MKNPHFDEDCIIWKDEYSGIYAPPETGYSEQFDLQWKIAFEQNREYFECPGASTDDQYIADRVFEWTGKHPDGRTDFLDGSMGVCALDHPIDPSLIKGKNCIDIGCGMGRWTKTMLRIGAESVLSVDMSESGLKSTSQFNPKTLRADITRLPEDHPGLVSQFDFACFWGVAMCTHDPFKAFTSAASTVAPGGTLYLMVYGPEGMHNTSIVNYQRKTFYSLATVEARLAYVDHVYHRQWDKKYPLKVNIKNAILNIIGSAKGNKIGVLDMLEPFYNWVIPLETIYSWMGKAGFSEISLLNGNEKNKCAYHVLGTNKRE